jgi:hypothetical protein
MNFIILPFFCEMESYRLHIIYYTTYFFYEE